MASIGNVEQAKVGRWRWVPHQLRDAVKYRDLLRNLVVRDLKVRYRGSVLGFIWSLLNPLLMMLIFWFVFSKLLGTKIPHFPLFLLAALLPWTWCATTVSGCVGSIVGNGNLINKVYFPRELLPFATVISNGINFLLSLPTAAALIIYYLIYYPQHYGEGVGLPGGVVLFNPFNWNLLWIPVLVLTQVIFLTGLGLFLAALNVYFRDTSMIVEVGLQAWFFLTPILFDLTTVAGWATQYIYWLNPMASIISSWRIILYNGAHADPGFILRTLITAMIVFVVGYVFFSRLSRSFGEEI